MQAHNLLKSSNKKAKRIGRGGKRGSFSGRGIKGQKSRAGRRIRPQIRDIIKKIHKRRGYRFRRGFAEKVAVVNLRDLEKKFKDGEKITKELLIERGLIRSKRPVKILGSGKLIKKFIFDKDILMSRPVKEKFNVG
ncbi:hypothetical protein A2661_00100 [Candidatus Giovannonibacteria bacterium RIFCSPHIGHO2_01_FULL_45_24]|uniref:50S ribosomal protein L15 n=1 Tax=Candidatus Giovannonibacteria bacterium RIFCSPLOWO2_01_FULL_46_32 TaxID=1798353 RepID=A0A1F5XII1_9BACT|nr:MAG: hypothetical protein A2661_00100 [Candidatus Giovannonibacteria bacterium RIFCSPHIGHO2_01_FULL_45_24]OGF87687.1 MAG: hypothetical protein A3B19_01730 [Candidatus Giovannonibacteria bacterium RIFCSPLOWO2_01_FULL_46_32]